jgi:glycosyltransferase involved in cell wall biosynthesis
MMRESGGRVHTPGVYLVCTQASLQSGATYAMARVASIGRDSGYRVLMAGPWSADVEAYLRSQGLEIEQIPISPLRGPRAVLHNLKWLLTLPWQVLSLIRSLRGFGASLVHANEISDVVALVAARLAGLPLVLHIRAHLESRFQAKLLLWIVDKLCHSVIVPSRSVKTWIERERLQLAPKVEIINEVAFDPDEFRSGSRQRGRNSLGLSEGQKLVLLVSKLGILKGHLVFLEAVERTVSQLDEPTVFAVAGDLMTDHYAEAELIRERARLARERGADVRMLGFRGDVPDLTAAADVFVHCPIYPDPFPTVILQAMSAGRAVIGSRIGGIVEQIQPGETGLLVPAGDPGELAAAIVKLVENDQLREQLGAAAGEYAAAAFSVKTQAIAQTAHYQKLMEQRNSSIS